MYRPHSGHALLPGRGITYVLQTTPAVTEVAAPGCGQHHHPCVVTPLRARRQRAGSRTARCCDWLASSWSRTCKVAAPGFT
jgi:hypothetical protein